MTILVDYRCRDCGSHVEHWAPSPPPPLVGCAQCGGTARRLFAAVGLSGRASASGETTSPPGAPGRRRPLCSDYPQIPGLCHMSESAGRMWVAKYRRDGRAIDREQQRQEEAAATRTPTIADAISHQHTPAPAPAPAPGPAPAP